MVVPPARAALVPWQKSSAGVMPKTGICSLVWTSMPPGRTSRPCASMVLMPPGTMRFSPICLKATQISLVIKSLDQNTNGEAGKHLLGPLEEKGSTAKTSLTRPLGTVREHDTPPGVREDHTEDRTWAHVTALVTSVGLPRAVLLTGGWSACRQRAEKLTGAVSIY